MIPTNTSCIFIEDVELMFFSLTIFYNLFYYLPITQVLMYVVFRNLFIFDFNITLL